mmetsp:Transcript_6814/g.15550  ORF Transcript_6814/g.15550 Transcript_6814/m.15550 type:complete len:82 (-) Transcript_6814:2481-2726(-)
MRWLNLTPLSYCTINTTTNPLYKQRQKTGQISVKKETPTRDVCEEARYYPFSQQLPQSHSHHMPTAAPSAEEPEDRGNCSR